jgi:D-serine deaminase-like pyridoxal phosphate-dependent protein
MAFWYEIENIDKIDSPALVVYPDRILKNIHEMIRVAGSPSDLQPHVKTYKMAEIVEMQINHRITKFKCATIAEGEMLGIAGAEKVLLAYQPVGPKMNRLLELTQKFPKTKFAALVDNSAAAKVLSETFTEAHQTLDVYLDVDVGMHRTGIPPDEKAFELFLFCKALKGINPVGLHAYDGHIRDTDLTLRKSKCDEGFKPVETLAKKIETLEGKIPIIIAGGSPTFPIHGKRPNVLASPGTCLFWDWGYAEMFPDQKFQHAALVVTRIISKPDTDKICVDLGHKSIAAEQPFPRVHFLNFPDAKQISQSEEHLVLKVENNADLEIGKVLYGIPKHICPTCALYEKTHVVENGIAEKEWRIVARDRKITI